MSEFKVDPADYGMTVEAARTLHRLYVVEERSMEDAVRLAKEKAGQQVTRTQGKQFIRDNRWVRPQRFYAKKSVWCNYNHAHFEQTMRKKSP